MQFPIVQEYRTDINRSNPENEIFEEPFKVAAGLFTRVIVPRHSPFFVESLVLKYPNGEPMILNEDYEIFRIMPRLTELVGKPVACMVTLKKPEITEGTLSYHVLGEFPLLDSTMLGLILDAINDDRPVYWENIANKPSVFPPTLHTHSLLYDIVAFQDTIDFLGELQVLIEQQGMDIIERRLTHFMELVDWYIGVYGNMLDQFLLRHKNSYDAHGLTRADVGLSQLDNYATATPADILQARHDMHLRPQELKSIIEYHGFNADEFLEAKNLPVAQFGNTNFIPPNIDGSYEGLGGVIETAGMCLENDNSITVLWNRMDGRTRGLYFSVLTDPEKPAAKLTYTGFKYEHPRFDPDAANVDKIAQGSGGECILVGDSFKDIYYIGLTNGSLDPAKHVYSKINLRPLVDAISTTPGSHFVSELFGMVSVAMMGDWLYIILSASTGVPSAAWNMYSGLKYKHFFRVPISSVKAQLDVTAVKQNLTFLDGDGLQWNNSPYYRWFDTIIDGNGHVTKESNTFSPYPCNQHIGLYRSLITHVAQNPNNPSSYAMKFLGAHYSAYVSETINSAMDYMQEINYDFNPYTGVMTFKTRSGAFNANFALGSGNIIPVQYRPSSSISYQVYFYQSQGGNILDDGRVAVAGAYGFTGYPRAVFTAKTSTTNTRFATTNKFWGNGSEIPFGNNRALIPETVTAPTPSGINVRAMLYNPGGEYYIASDRTETTTLKMYWKTVSGRFAYRTEIQNLFMSNIVSRPLTNNIREVNAPFGIGGATVVVPSANLSAYGVDVGESQFCVNSQKSSFNREVLGNAWPGGVADGDIILIQQHTRRIEADGKVTIVPTLELLYQQWIVDAIKAQVEFPAIMARGRAVHVTVCDPTFSNLTAKFGWLPVLASVYYTDANGTPDQNTLFSTFMVLQPTYTTSNGRYVVTGFSVVNKMHTRAPSAGVNILRIFGNGIQWETPQTTHGPMRVQYYLEGNKLTVYHGCGVMAQVPGDAYTRDYTCTFNDRNASHAWSSATFVEHTSRGGGIIMSPDNGIQVMRGWDLSTGGAATISEGIANYALIGSVYPEVGWVIFFKTDINVIFNGTLYVLPLGSIDLRDVDPSPQWKTYYIYAILDNGVPRYDVSMDKRLETNYQLWVGTVVTNDRQILTIERYNVFALDGHRVTETKRGNSIPAASGLANTEGQIPWLRTAELLP